MFPYEKNDIETRLLPIWTGNVIHNETAMFVGKQDRVTLLYPPTKILSVTSYDRHKVYQEGKDFILCEDGSIALTEHTRIPYMTEDAYYHGDPSSILFTMHNGKEIATHCGEGVIMTRWQVAITYEHSASETAFVPPCQASRFEVLNRQLSLGEDVNILFFGDSITAGCTASYYSKIDPHMPSWPALISEHLAKRYSYTVHYVQTGLAGACRIPSKDAEYGSRGFIRYINTAVGGWNANHAVDRFDERVSDWITRFDCDLLVLGFGMNDGKKSADELVGLLRNVIDRALIKQPKLSILLISTMLPNPETKNTKKPWYRNQDTFEDAMIAMADDYLAKGIPCAVAPVTSMSRSVLARKRFRDISGNNINHPNDFMIRLYAQTVIQTLVGFKH